MKKLLLTLLFALLATSLITSGATAATIFKKDGFTYKVKGDLQIQLRKEDGNDQEVEVEYDDLELRNYVGYDLGNNLTAFGELDFGFKKAADNSERESSQLEQAYLGLSYENYTFMIGKSYNAADYFGIYAGKEDYVSEDIFYFLDTTRSDDMVMLKARFDNANILVSHEFESEDRGSDANGTSTEILAEYGIADFKFQAAFQTHKKQSDDDATNTWGLSVAYDAKVVQIAADYGVADRFGEYDIALWNVGIKAPVATTTTVGAGYTSLEYDDEAGKDDVAGWYANVVYCFPKAKNVSLIAEIGDTDEEDHDMGALAGLNIKF